MSKHLTITVYDTDYDTGERVGEPIRVLTPEAGAFAYDGCHKIYLIFNEGDLAKMIELGYGQDDDGESAIFPVSELPAVWDDTCGLRFISRADLTEQLVAQFEDADVTWE